MNLKGKTVLIVGGAAGIGLATAHLCANSEAQVVIADLNENAGTEAANAINATFFQVNVADEASVKALFARVEQQFGRLDVLLHTAGILKGAYVPIEEFSLDLWRSVIDINLTGSFLC